MSDDEDYGRYITEITSDVQLELDERLIEAAGPYDHLAIVSAVNKAAWRGFMRGLASAHEAIQKTWVETTGPELRRYLPPGVELPEVFFDAQINTPGEPDHWRDLFGDDGPPTT
jgi:hypothetical protein